MKKCATKQAHSVHATTHNKRDTVSEAKQSKGTTSAKAAHTLLPRIEKSVSNTAVANATHQVNKDDDTKKG